MSTASSTKNSELKNRRRKSAQARAHPQQSSSKKKTAGASAARTRAQRGVDISRPSAGPKTAGASTEHTPLGGALAQRLAGLARLAQTQDPLRDDDQPGGRAQLPPAEQDSAELANPFALWTQWLSSWTPTGAAASLHPPFGGGGAFAGALPMVSISPEALLDLQKDYVERLSLLWADFVEHPEQVAAPIDDTRFSDKAWQESPLASLTARNYLLNAEFLNRMAEHVDGDDKTRRRVQFAIQQWVDASAPSNFYALNPKAQQIALETRGESLKAGLDNLIKDVARGKISQSDESAFEVGRNVATSAGQVIFENELIQLIQYAPLTEKVRTVPLLIVPPSINKFYVLDLQPQNSLVRFALEQGNRVFMVSWKNPHEPQAKMTWDDYVELGVIKALEVASDVAGVKQINTLGFCVGGTLLAIALAVLEARGQTPAASLTLLTTLLDFEHAGVLDIFIDEAHVRMREQTIGAGGLMPGKDLANTFSSLRPNDLVWNYVVANYLEGRAPPAFDLLYWNGDSTNLPGPMYAWYLRNTYLENNLKVPGKLKVCGSRLDLGRIKVPTYVFAAREDHIVPWQSAYTSVHCLSGVKNAQFVLGASGHIAGTINPASKNKRCYWVRQGSHLPKEAEAWLDSARQVPGSWWLHWDPWLAKLAGAQTKAPTQLGNARYRPIEPAPGRYVKEKA